MFCYLVFILNIINFILILLIGIHMNKIIMDRIMSQSINKNIVAKYRDL